MELSNFAVICMLLLAAVFQLSMGQEWGIAYGKRASQVVYYNHLNNHYMKKKINATEWFIKSSIPALSLKICLKLNDPEEPPNNYICLKC